MEVIDRDLPLLRELLSIPTAPFCEAGVIAFIERWAVERGIAFSRDRGGNVLLRAGSPTAGGWVFQAHLDHPGWTAVSRRGRKLWAEFHGGVGSEYFAGARARFYVDGGSVGARVSDAAPRTDGEYPIYRLELDEAVEVPPGTLGMWDLPACRVRGRVLSARACDDLAGAASILRALEELAGTGGRATALLTRAEEVGFVGAMSACREGSLPQGAVVVSVETSKQMGDARLGGGAVVRVGDRASVFDPAVTGHLTATALALELTSRQRSFRYVRQLMNGGTCESTVFCGHGIAAGALCLPLGNYHNMGPGGKIALERIHLDDFACLVRLLVATAQTPPPQGGHAPLPPRVNELFERRGGAL